MHYVKFPKPRSKRIKLILLSLFFLAIFFGWVFLNRNTNSTAHFIYDNLPLVDSSPGRINILLLGNAGGKHDGAYLTDTMMVASLDSKSRRIILFSLPRDLWLDDQKLKLNAVYQSGRAKSEGLDLSKKIVGAILGIPIHNGVRVDFNGFIKAVNELGGVEINIDRSFDDYLYPIEGRENDLCGFEEKEIDFNEEEAKKLNIPVGKRKVLTKYGFSGEAANLFIATDSAEPDKGYEYFKCRYEHLSFSTGRVRLDGGTALKFVRSRMGTNGEGSDFARSKRQQKILEAFRASVLSVQTLTNPARINALIKTFGDSIETDLDVADIISLYSIIKDIKTTQSFVLGGARGDSLLIHPPLDDYGGAWVLVPQNNNFNAIQRYVRDVLEGEVESNESSGSARTSGI